MHAVLKQHDTIFDPFKVLSYIIKNPSFLVLTLKCCLLAIGYLYMRRKAQLPKPCNACLELALMLGSTWLDHC